MSLLDLYGEFEADSTHDLSARASGCQPQSPRRRHIYRDWIKRCADIASVIAAVPFVIPLLMVLALLVARDGAWPFFAHKRIGRGGKQFYCWKLRSMVPDADVALRRYLAENTEANREWIICQKLRHDPRITPIGRLLRATSLDELPQLWNILRGDMSLVGPRPVVADELARYGAARRHYVALRPGLTGLWQVSGRNRLSYKQRVVLDVAYARHHCALLDFTIIIKTIREVFIRSGH